MESYQQTLKLGNCSFLIWCDV